MSSGFTIRWLPRERFLPEMLEQSDAFQSTLTRSYYQPRNSIKVMTWKGQLTISPSDQFDVADTECIRVMREGFEFQIPWAIVSRIKIAG